MTAEPIDADVDAAFCTGPRRPQAGLRLLGAKWCPPCNQAKATLFNRMDFIERSRAFVPVYIDGDRPGAQKLGTRSKVRGYPTMVLFNSDGVELTRLPGEVDASQYTQVLTLLGVIVTKDPLNVARPAPKRGMKLLFQAWMALAKATPVEGIVHDGSQRGGRPEP